MFIFDQSDSSAVFSRSEAVAEAGAVSPRLHLADAEPGQRLRIEAVEAGRRLQARLISMGLPLGSEVTVLHKRSGGVVLATPNGRFALGQGMAKKMVVAVMP